MVLAKKGASDAFPPGYLSGLSNLIAEWLPRFSTFHYPPITSMPMVWT